MANGKTSKITTIKLKSETKERLDHLKEFGRESYDEILLKMLHILNQVRSNPESAQSILRAIDLKTKRNQQVYSSIPAKKPVEIRKIPQERRIRPIQRQIPRSIQRPVQRVIQRKFIIKR